MVVRIMSDESQQCMQALFSNRDFHDFAEAFANAMENAPEVADARAVWQEKHADWMGGEHASAYNAARIGLMLGGAEFGLNDAEDRVVMTKEPQRGSYSENYSDFLTFRYIDAHRQQAAENMVRKPREAFRQHYPEQYEQFAARRTEIMQNIPACVAGGLVPPAPEPTPEPSNEGPAQLRGRYK